MANKYLDLYKFFSICSSFIVVFEFGLMGIPFLCMSSLICLLFIPNYFYNELGYDVLLSIIFLITCFFVIKSEILLHFKIKKIYKYNIMKITFNSCISKIISLGLMLCGFIFKFDNAGNTGIFFDYNINVACFCFFINVIAYFFSCVSLLFWILYKNSLNYPKVN
jgi:hypothetical protein